ncbi:MAG: hypothetical protein WCL08_02810 [Verrucomicrobiota bacterium]
MFKKPPSSTRWPYASFVIILSLLGLISCKPEITDSNINAVNQRFDKLGAAKKYLSPKEVESILGQPDRVENATLELETQKKQVPVTRYYYDQDGQTTELHFFDNKLIKRVPAFSKTPEQEPQKP